MSCRDCAHLRRLMDERDIRYQQRFEAQEAALTERAKELGERLDILNGLRGDVATKQELSGLEKIVSELSKWTHQREGRSTGLSTGWSLLAGAIVLALAIYAAFS